MNYIDLFEAHEALKARLQETIYQLIEVRNAIPGGALRDRIDVFLKAQQRKEGEGG